MITTNDYSYKETKQILKNNKKLNPILRELANWINNKYNVNVINICYEIIEIRGSKTPRLEVVFESVDEVQVFYEERGYNYDPQKRQEIISELRDILSAGQSEALNSQLKIDYDTNNMFVIFSAFAPIAQSEANSQIATSDIHLIRDRWRKNGVWEISRSFDSVTVFFFTQEQVLANKSSQLKKRIESEYYELLKEKDEFGYYKKYGFSIMVDSKENFDKNYQSNWYYYYK